MLLTYKLAIQGLCFTNTRENCSISVTTIRAISIWEVEDVTVWPRIVVLLCPLRGDSISDQMANIIFAFRSISIIFLSDFL